MNSWDKISCTLVWLISSPWLWLHSIRRHKMHRLQECVKHLLTSPQLMVALALAWQWGPHTWLGLTLMLLVVWDLFHAFLTTPVKVSNPEKWSVVIGGAGVSGLGMAKRLVDVGITNIVILEKYPKLGGTWYENKYPGIACDVPRYANCCSNRTMLDILFVYSHFYSFSFYLNPWFVYMKLKRTY